MSKQLEAALKWLDAFDSCVYSGPAFAAEHARTIKAEMSRLTVERDPDVGHTVGDGKLREALIKKAQAAYDAVADFPERRGDPMEVGTSGFMDLLTLRNLVPELIAALSVRDAGEGE